jgi:hypothetical protein
MTGTADTDGGLESLLGNFIDLGPVRSRRRLGWQFDFTCAVDKVGLVGAAERLWLGVHAALVADGADGVNASKRAWRAARLAVILCLFDCQQKEAADLLRVSASTAKGDMTRVRQAIRDGCLRAGAVSAGPVPAPDDRVTVPWTTSRLRGTRW